MIVDPGAKVRDVRRKEIRSVFDASLRLQDGRRNAGVLHRPARNAAKRVIGRHADQANLRRQLLHCLARLNRADLTDFVRWRHERPSCPVTKHI